MVVDHQNVNVGTNDKELVLSWSLMLALRSNTAMDPCAGRHARSDTFCDQQASFSWMSTGTYRFGFNGKENDNEVNGSTGTCYDYGFRIYDPRLARFLSVDPLSRSYPWYTPYQFAGNMPIAAIDIDGLEEYLVIHWQANGQTKATTVIHLTNDLKADRQSHDIAYATMDYERLQNYLNPNGSLNIVQFGSALQRPPNEGGDRGSYVDGQGNNITNRAREICSQNFPWDTEFRADEKSMKERGLADYDAEFQVSDGDQSFQSTFASPGGVILLTIPDLSDKNFATGSAELNTSGMAQLDLLYKAMVVLPDSKFSLNGHTDDVGDDASNQRLSLERANAAMRYLVSKGIDSSRLSAVGMGKASPKVPNDNDANRSVNRRVEVVRTN